MCVPLTEGNNDEGNNDALFLSEKGNNDSQYKSLLSKLIILCLNYWIWFVLLPSYVEPNYVNQNYTQTLRFWSFCSGRKPSKFGVFAYHTENSDFGVLNILIIFFKVRKPSDFAVFAVGANPPKNSDCEIKTVTMYYRNSDHVRNSDQICPSKVRVFDESSTRLIYWRRTNEILNVGMESYQKDPLHWPYWFNALYRLTQTLVPGLFHQSTLLYFSEEIGQL